MTFHAKTQRDIQGSWHPSLAGRRCFFGLEFVASILPVLAASNCLRLMAEMPTQSSHQLEDRCKVTTRQPRDKLQ
jgi:hypothetical protein